MVFYHRGARRFLGTRSGSQTALSMYNTRPVYTVVVADHHITDGPYTANQVRSTAITLTVASEVVDSINIMCTRIVRNADQTAVGTYALL